MSDAEGSRARCGSRGRAAIDLRIQARAAVCACGSQVCDPEAHVAGHAAEAEVLAVWAGPSGLAGACTSCAGGQGAEGAGKLCVEAWKVCDAFASKKKSAMHVQFMLHEICSFKKRGPSPHVYDAR